MLPVRQCGKMHILLIAKIGNADQVTINARSSVIVSRLTTAVNGEPSEVNWPRAAALRRDTVSAPD